MDFSSLPEGQQQQLQQLQQKFQEHLAQQQQQQHQEQEQAQTQHSQQQQYQDYASQSYNNPSQLQSYDQSYYSYYHQYPHDPQHHQQHYNYYQTAYTGLYSQPDPTSFYQPGVSGQPSDGSGQCLVRLEHQQSAYYPQQVGPGVEQSDSVPTGLNPAAAAALAALSELAGTMDAAQRAMMGGPGSGQVPGLLLGSGSVYLGPGPVRPQVGLSPYRGGGRRGGGQFRGGGRGNSGNRASRRGGSGPPFRGRGRGRGRHGPTSFPPQGSSPLSNPELHATGDEESTEEESETSPDNPKEGDQTVAPSQTSAPGNAAPNRRPTQVAWCELCKAECTSLEILEQHKQGKRHKKNLQKSEQLNTANKHVPKIQNEQKSVAGSDPKEPLQPKNVQEGEESKQNLPESLPTEAATDENEMETKKQNNQAEQPEFPKEEQSTEQARKPRTNWFDNQRRGKKRNMRGGSRGGKRMKTDAPRRPIEPRKPKVVIPLMCNLCNVRCDTQEVFDRHLSGKKHISKVKRFEGHQAMYGPTGLQALYPPNPIAQTLLHPQGLQQGIYGPPLPRAYMSPQAYHAAQAMETTGPGFHQTLPQMSDAIPKFGGREAVPEAQ